MSDVVSSGVREFRATTLDAAITAAARELGCSVLALRYEVLQHPRAGLWGFFAKDAIIAVQTQPAHEKSARANTADKLTSANEELDCSQKTAEPENCAEGGNFSKTPNFPKNQPDESAQAASAVQIAAMQKQERARLASERAQLSQQPAASEEALITTAAAGAAAGAEAAEAAAGATSEQGEAAQNAQPQNAQNTQPQNAQNAQNAAQYEIASKVSSAHFASEANFSASLAALEQPEQPACMHIVVPERISEAELERCRREVQALCSIKTPCEVQASQNDFGALELRIQAQDAELLIGREGYKFAALDMLLNHYSNIAFSLHARVDVNGSLVKMTAWLQPVLEQVRLGVQNSGRASTEPLCPTLLNIAYEQLAREFSHKIINIKDGPNGRYICIWGRYDEYYRSSCKRKH